MRKLQLFFYSSFIFLFISSCSHSPNYNKSKSCEHGNESGIKLFVFNCGDTMVKDVSVFSPGHDKGIAKELQVSCYLIKHPKGTLLWDTGLPDSLSEKPEGLVVKDGLFHLTVNKTLMSQLDEINVSPDSINYVAFSHMHFDHTGNANYFKNSQIIMQEEEWSAAFGPHPEKFGFEPSSYNQLINNKFIKLKEDYDVFEDGTVVILRAPGHTPGHQALFINLPQTGPVVLSGDLYHFTNNRKFRRVPSFNFNKKMTRNSMKKIEKFVVDHKAQLWIQHDLEQNKEIKHSPEFYR